VLFSFSFYSGNLASKNESSFTEQTIKERTAVNLLQRLPLYFIENKGQVNEKVQYQVKFSGMNAYFTSEEIVYQFFHREGEKTRVENVRMKFLGANKRVRVEGLEESEAKVNYFRGNNPERWVRGARTYKKVIYRELYPDIDLVIYGEGGKIKHEYRVKVGGEVENIKIKYEGIKGLRIRGLRGRGGGELEIILKEGEIEEEAPVSYQMIDGKKKKPQ